MSRLKNMRSVVEKISAVFLVFAGFLVVFFSVSKSRMPITQYIPDGIGGIAHADAPSCGDSASCASCSSGDGGDSGGDSGK